jgi:hypothetical protein
MLASITQIEYVPSFLVNQILICYCHSQIFELYLIFKCSITSLYVMILFCILVTAYQHILSSICIYV